MAVNRSRQQLRRLAEAFGGGMIRKACGQDSVTTGFVSYVVWDGGKSSTWVAWRNNFDGEGVRVDEFETAEAAMVATDDCLSDGSSA